MQRALFFDGQDVQWGDITAIEDGVEAEVSRRIVDIAVQTGIITGLAVTQSAAYQASVAVGTAYDSAGEWLNITVPQTIAYAATDATKYVVGQHAVQDYQPVEHPITGVLNNTRRRDIVTLALVSTPGPTDVVLTRITAVDGSGNATFDNTVRKFWGARLAPGTVTDNMLDPNGAVITHINARGTGTFGPHNPHALSPQDIGVVQDPTAFNHQVLDHVNGIEAGSSSTAAQVTVDAAPAPDQLDVTQLGISDHILINGQRLTSANALGPTPLLFTSAPANPCLYEVLLDSTALVTAYIRAQYNAPKTITGVQVVDVSPSHALGSFTLTWNQATQTLAWGGGATQKIDAPSGATGETFNGDRFYLLRRGAGVENQWILVWVDYSQLPVIGASDGVTINASQVDQNHLALATAPWSGSATGFLGYGDQSASGQAFDKRLHGNLDVVDLADNLLQMLFYTRFKETRADGFVVLNAPVVSSLNFTIPYTVAYVAGKRFEIPSATIAVPDASTHYLYVDYTGAWVLDVEDPAVVQSDAPPRRAMGWKLVTAGGVITTTTDLRVDLRDPDSSPVKTTRTNTFVQPQIFNGQSADDSASIEVTYNPTARKLVGQAAAGTAGRSVRLYATSGTAWELTSNCSWNASLSKWVPDDNTLASTKVVVGPDRIYTYSKNTGASNWADNAWDVNALQINYVTQAFTWSASLVAASLIATGVVQGASGSFSGGVSAGGFSTGGTVSAGALSVSGGGSVGGTLTAGAVSAGSGAITNNLTSQLGACTLGYHVYPGDGNVAGNHVALGTNGAIFYSYWSMGLALSQINSYYETATCYSSMLSGRSGLLCLTEYPNSAPTNIAVLPFAATGDARDRPWGTQILWQTHDLAHGGNAFNLSGSLFSH